MAGYYADERSVRDIADEILGMADGGYERIKVMLDGADPSGDVAFLQALMTRLGGRAALAADAHWACTTMASVADMPRD